jgi:hypothetical protein
MTSYVRYGVYYVPPEGPLAAFGAAWLGWDIAAGAPAGLLDVAGLDVGSVTAAPRRYGFHATLKPPFHLAPGTTAQQLGAAVAALAAGSAAVRVGRLRLSRLGGFLALTPEGPCPALDALAARAVAGLDRFRAPPDAGETARRSAPGLTPRQRENLARWGYAFVMEDFLYHMTLTGPLTDPAPVEAALAGLIAPVLPELFVIESLALVGERADGMFELVHRYPLAPSSAASA